VSIIKNSSGILGQMLEFYGDSNMSVFVSRLNIRVDLIKSFIGPIHVTEANEACSLVVALIKLGGR
jgi:hypothetical protein